MSKHDSAPTHSWVIGSHINKWLALAFMIVFLLVFFFTMLITYTIRRDCNDVYVRDLAGAGYWLHIEIGSTKPGCPRYES